MSLQARQLSKHFGDCAAVRAVSLEFAPGLIHAVLGENGAGKSTLMKLFFGLHQPSSGEILVEGKVTRWNSSLDAIQAGLGMVQQHFTLVETLSVIDNIMLGAEVCNGVGRLHREQAIARLEGLLPSDNLALPWRALVRELSVGQKQRLEILKLLFRESKILFLDEPTAVLTPPEIEDFFAVLRQLKAQGKTIVLITHKINEVLSVCDTYAVLRHGELKAQGQVSEASVDSIVESMIGRKIPELAVERVHASTKPVLNVRQLRDSANHLHEVSLHVNAGEIVGVAGVEGSGQSQLVEAALGLCEFFGDIQIMGENIRFGETAKARRLGLGLIPEDRLSQGLWLEESCSVNMALGLEERFLKHEIIQFSELRRVTAEWADDFDVRAPSLEIPVRALSGGNQQKIIFAREVSGRAPKLLICHQPTRGVDLGAIDLIHRRLLDLRNQGVGILVVSSELDELLKLCDRLYVFFAGQISAEFSRLDFSRQRVGRAMTGVNHA